MLPRRRTQIMHSRNNPILVSLLTALALASSALAHAPNAAHQIRPAPAPIRYGSYQTPNSNAYYTGGGPFQPMPTTFATQDPIDKVLESARRAQEQARIAQQWS